jgi:hypothetical protein
VKGTPGIRTFNDDDDDNTNNNNNNNNNNTTLFIYLTASGLSPGGSGYYAYTSCEIRI